jgi:hypothetical protein
VAGCPYRADASPASRWNAAGARLIGLLWLLADLGFIAIGLA